MVLRKDFIDYMKRLKKFDGAIGVLTEILFCGNNCDNLLNEVSLQYGELLITATSNCDADNIPDNIWSEFWDTVSCSTVSEQEMSELYDLIKEETKVNE